jgi:hypothetical protein
VTIQARGSRAFVPRSRDSSARSNQPLSLGCSRRRHTVLTNARNHPRWHGRLPGAEQLRERVHVEYALCCHVECPTQVANDSRSIRVTDILRLHGLKPQPRNAWSDADQLRIEQRGRKQRAEK